MEQQTKGGSHKNIWYGLGRQRIEIPKTVLKSRVHSNEWLRQLYICSLGYYPRAAGHYTYRKKGLPENFLFYCVDGSGWYKIGNKKFTINANEFFILPQNVEHSYGSSEKDPWSIYWVHFGGEMSASFNAMHAVKKHFHPCHIKTNDEIFSLFTKLYETLELGYSTSNLLFANMCLSHFLSLFIFNGKYFTVAPHQKTDFIDSAILFMQEHIHENITLNELCKHYQYSPSRFSNLFKQKTGYAPMDYFSQMKMQRASQQLDSTNVSIKSIASKLGYDDPYYFSRKFTKIIGMSPSKYRAIKKH
jgi:AraC family transcriptional regulator, arabinose operon regulatory protein